MQKNALIAHSILFPVARFCAHHMSHSGLKKGEKCSKTVCLQYMMWLNFSLWSRSLSIDRDIICYLRYLPLVLLQVAINSILYNFVQIASSSQWSPKKKSVNFGHHYPIPSLITTTWTSKTIADYPSFKPAIC